MLELFTLFKTIESFTKIENFIHRNYKATHSKVKIVKLTKTENCYYAEPDDNFCINVVLKKIY